MIFFDRVNSYTSWNILIKFKIDRTGSFSIEEVDQKQNEELSEAIFWMGVY